MNETIMAAFDCYVVAKQGISSKTGKPYFFKVLRVDTGEYGEVEIPLDTKTDRGGIVLDLITKRKE